MLGVPGEELELLELEDGLGMLGEELELLEDGLGVLGDELELLLELLEELGILDDEEEDELDVVSHPARTPAEMATSN